MHQLQEERDNIQKRWHTDKGLLPMHIEILQLMMRESIQVVENVELDAKASKVEMKLKIKDAQINKLRE